MSNWRARFDLAGALAGKAASIWAGSPTLSPAPRAAMAAAPTASTIEQVRIGFIGSQMPGRPHRPGQPAVGFGIAHELLAHRVPAQLPSEVHGDPLLLHHRLVADGNLYVADGLLPRANGVQQIAAMIVAPHRSEEHTSELQSLRHL